MHARMTSELPRFFRFALVGGTGFLVDAGLLTALHNLAGVDPFTARLASITASAFTTWRLNRSLTFGASQRGQAAEGLLYAVVAAITAALNYLVYVLILIAWHELPPLAAAVVATLAAMLFSYAGYSRVVFAGAATVVGPPSSQRR
jgi:putative flippase GtrA